MTLSADWQAVKAHKFLGVRSILAIAIDRGQLRDLRAFGGNLAGIVLVVPRGKTVSECDDGVPTLTLHSTRSNIFAHVTADFSATLERHASRVRAFFDHCDPHGEAAVVAVLPVARHVLGERTVWAQSEDLRRTLEAKRATGELLAGRLPAIPDRIVRWPMSHTEWNAAVRELNARRVVVQDAGLSGGGSGTWMVDDWTQAVERVDPLLAEVRLLPYLEGTPCNVTAMVCASGNVVVFPPSVQLMTYEPAGCPVYAGNLLGCMPLNPVASETIRDEVRLFGRHLASLGYKGPFGLDFISAPDGTRHYHDVNPRVNGVVDSLAQYFLFDGASPLRVFTLCPVGFTEQEAAELERCFELAVRRQPRWRFFLTRLLMQPWSGDREVPASGRWRIDPTGPSMRCEGPPCTVDELAADEALLLSTLSKEQQYEASDRLVLGDLYCKDTLGRALWELHGDQASLRLVDGFLR